MANLSTIKHLYQSNRLYHPARTLYWRLLKQERLVKFHQEVTFYSQLLEPDSLCFDIGANIGEKTEALFKAGMRVVAFEPQPNCMKELAARCSRYRSKLTKCECAVGAEPGITELYVHTHHAHSSLDQNWTVSEVVSSVYVPVVTLDRAIAKFGKPRYCKIDVEGWEYEVLKGLTQPIPLISFEYHLQGDNIDKTLACIDYLSHLGELHINITPAETLLFTFQEWLPVKEFLQSFPNSFRSRQEYNYGDIFVKIQ
ncbi:FkbM family methyltransferase [Chroococcidiopsis sp. FACHB-1243]|uniref:FkbM family methyltransferase n=1 Tax=Chroococcidiopsis sp. [FACHB-1243] TaxID=2692781 RepID=UPI00177CBF58|nr:FkbM family methyltransferase [Chroococcidiopsis sp. [FACHB-1243]]MBD2305768.1 FkbM family methyltransferase [Chroococcidiopsis sp. [FACHB-1243]]